MIYKQHIAAATKEVATIAVAFLSSFSYYVAVAEVDLEEAAVSLAVAKVAVDA